MRCSAIPDGFVAPVVAFELRPTSIAALPRADTVIERERCGGAPVRSRHRMRALTHRSRSILHRRRSMNRSKESTDALVAADHVIGGERWRDRTGALLC